MTSPRSKFSCAALSVAGLMYHHLWDPTVSSDSSRSALKTHLFASYQDTWRIRGNGVMRYKNALVDLTWISEVELGVIAVNASV